MNIGEKVFITGGLGFVGTYLSKHFLDHGDHVIVYDVLKSYISPLGENLFHEYIKHRYNLVRLHPNLEIIEGDVRDYAKLQEAMTRTQPDKVIHLAALSIADLSDKHPYEAVTANLHGTMNVLDAIRNTPSVKKYVNISSSMVYGDFKYKPCDEKHPTDPKGIYGGTKLAGETMTRVYTQRFGIPHIIIRPSAVYGPTDANRRVTQIFLERAFAGKPITLHNGGASELDFTYVADTVQGMFLAAKRDDVVNETFNITRGEGRSLKDLADILKSYFPDVQVELTDVPENERKPERGAMDISKARTMLGYDPQYSLEKGMAEYIDFMKNLHSSGIALPGFLNVA